MNRSARLIAASLAAAVCLWPVAISAQEAPLPVAGLTVEQARGAFSGAGYQVEPPLDWDWSSPPVSTFRVFGEQGRVLMVLVYSDSATAQTERAQALANERVANPDVTSPHLVSGFGASVWRGNVALVQSSQSELQRLVQAQTDRENGIYVDDIAEREPSVPTFAVDLDFQQALDFGAANL
jgi:hypothetical protein